MQQGYDGQWYDDNWNPVEGPDAGGSQPSGGAQGLPNEPANFDWSTVKTDGTMFGFNPDGTPHYNAPMPGYDASHDPYQGSWQINNPSGAASWNWLQSPSTDTRAAGGTTNWGDLSRNIFGTMPSVGDATPPPFDYAQWQAPAPFAPPSADDVLFSDPGFGFRRDQGTQAMQQSAAARGVLNTGGTLQDLVDYGQKAASQEYGGAFNRALGTYDENYRNSLNSYITNFGNALTKYNTNYGTQYLTPYNQLMQQYGTGMQGQGQLFNQQFQTATA